MNYAILNHNEGPHLDCTQPNYVSPALHSAILFDFRFVRKIQVGLADFGDCWIFGRHRRPDRKEIQPALFARRVSRSHCGQTSALVVVYRSGFREATRLVAYDSGAEPRPAHPDRGGGDY